MLLLLLPEGVNASTFANKRETTSPRIAALYWTMLMLYMLMMIDMSCGEYLYKCMFACLLD